jgi:hypothetical protein
MKKWCLRGVRFGARIMKQQADYNYNFKSQSIPDVDKFPKNEY